MTVIGVSIAVFILIAIWIKYLRARNQRELEQYSITPDSLHDMLSSNHRPLIFDVRLPLDLLADSEIIPGAQRIAPREVIENPSLIPKDKDVVIYCTCPADKTSRRILRHALGLNFFRVKLLKGGLAAWKAKDYPVEPYTTPFHLDINTGAGPSGLHNSPKLEQKDANRC